MKFYKIITFYLRLISVLIMNIVYMNLIYDWRKKAPVLFTKKLGWIR